MRGTDFVAACFWIVMAAKRASQRSGGLSGTALIQPRGRTGLHEGGVQSFVAACFWIVKVAKRAGWAVGESVRHTMIQPRGRTGLQDGGVREHVYEGRKQMSEWPRPALVVLAMHWLVGPCLDVLQ